MHSEFVFIAIFLTVLFFLYKKFYKNKVRSAYYLKIISNQSYELNGGIKTSIWTPDGVIRNNTFNNVTTVHEAFIRGFKISKDRPFLGELENEEYMWLTYRKVFNLCRRLGTSLIHMKLKPHDASSVVGIISKNCIAWTLVAETCSMYSFIFVPINEKLGHNACSQIICDAKIKVLVTENWSKVSQVHLTFYHETSNQNVSIPFKIMPLLTVQCSLAYLLLLSDESIDDIKMKIREENKKKRKKSLGLQIVIFNDTIRIGVKSLAKMQPPLPQSTCMIIPKEGNKEYSKCVVLTHESIMNNISARFYNDIQNKILPNKDDVYFSFMPGYHICERINQIIMMMVGGRIGFGSGEYEKMFSEVSILKPTYFVTFPFVLDRIHSQEKAKFKPDSLKKRLFSYAISKKIQSLERGIIQNNSVWDFFFFSSIQKKMGGKLRVIISGGSPLKGNVLTFARATFGCFIYEEYRMKEFGGAVTIHFPYETQTGTVGAPLPNCLFKLIDRPEFDYYVGNGVGEICIKSNSRMEGYALKFGLTNLSFDKDGFFKTGDIGRWNSNGTLKIVDRCNPVFKLSLGESVDPEKVEKVYAACSCISQIFVDANSTEEYCIAVVVPDAIYAKLQAIKNKTTPRDEKNMPLLKTEILEDMKKRAEEAALREHEKVRNIHLSMNEFTKDQGLLTPTSENNRVKLRRFFRNEIIQLYRQRD